MRIKLEGEGRRERERQRERKREREIYDFVNFSERFPAARRETF